MNRQNRFLHVLAGDLWGGKEAQMAVQLAALRKRNVEVETLLFNSGEVSERYLAAGIPSTIVSEQNGLIDLLRSSLVAARKLQPAAIIAHGYKEAVVGMWCSIKLKVPLAVFFHGAAEPYPGLAGLKMKGYEWTALLIARLFSRRAVCVSHALSRTLGLEGNRKLRVILNAKTSSSELPSTQSVFDKRPAIFAIGRLVRVKRFDLVIEAMKSLSAGMNAVLYIAGNGPEEDRLKEISRASGVDEYVKFLGYRNDATQMISSADALVISSDSEGIPTVLLDALQAGCPVVSTAVGGIPEVMEQFPNYPHELVAPGDATALAGALGRILSNRRPAPAERMAVLERLFSADRAASDQQTLYSELLEPQ